MDDMIVTDLERIRSILLEKKEKILCVFSQTSSFAPRMPDKVEEIAILCKEFGVNHLVNNAFGLCSSKICHGINMASKSGVVDFVVQSTDKNFMTPVGGSIVFSSSKAIMKEFA